MTVDKRFSHEDYAALVDETIEQINRLSKLKGGEYAGDVDRLANFRRNGLAMDLPMEVIWHTYAAKHWDAVTQYILDLRRGTARVRAEPLAGRLDDIIVYCILLKAMLVERAADAVEEVAAAVGKVSKERLDQFANEVCAGHTAPLVSLTNAINIMAAGEGNEGNRFNKR